MNCTSYTAGCQCAYCDNYRTVARNRYRKRKGIPLNTELYATLRSANSIHPSRFAPVKDCSCETCVARREYNRNRYEPVIERRLPLVYPRTRTFGDATCVNCGAQFTKRASRHKYCTPQCAPNYSPNWTPKAKQPKYNTPEYRAAYKALRKAQARGEWLTCAQPECVMPTRDIAPTDPAHVGHNDTGTLLIGPVHQRCNSRDGAIRGNQMRGTQRRRWTL